MNLVGGYSSPYYPANAPHLPGHPHEFYNSASQNMGMARYPWGPTTGSHTENHTSTDNWSPLTTHQAHSVQHPATSHPTTTLPTDPLVGVSVNSIDNFHHNGQYVIPPAPNGYSNVPMYDVMPDGTVKVRVVKRRNTANKKERRRTISINTAFASLRGCIPNVPSDTKLSKIKTLRLATSYIAYLMDILNKDDPTLTKGGFKAEITKKIEGREERRKREVEEMLRTARKEESKKTKGRTGWPQAVWASELKPETHGNPMEPQIGTSPVLHDNGSETDSRDTETENIMEL